MYWSDVPYAQRGSSNDFSAHTLVTDVSYQFDPKKKIALCEKYASQIKQVIADQKILTRAEHYFTFKKAKLPTVSVGTSALNEEKGIKGFLDSLSLQEERSFILEKIIINSDGSTDKTAQIAKAYPDRRISVIDNKVRKGRTARLLELFAMNTSDIFILLDTDMLLGSTTALENVVEKFSEKRIGMVSFNVMPVRSPSLVGSLLYRWEHIWFSLRCEMKGGRSIHNLRGGAFALRKNVLQHFTLSPAFHLVAEYLYHSLRKKGYSFTFAPDARIYYRVPEKLSDYLSSISRQDANDIQFMRDTFGKSIDVAYVMDHKHTYRTLLQSILRHPLSSIAAIGLVQGARLVVRNKSSLDARGFWPTTHSTKQAITWSDIEK